METNLMQTYCDKQNELFARWQDKYSTKIDRLHRFTFDGVVFDQDESKKVESWYKWENTSPKVLFLLKEAFGEYDPECPALIGRNFGINMTLWKYAISELYNNPEVHPIMDKCALSGLLDGVAIMEIKKLDEGKSKSSDKEIMQYAKEDKDLLKEQIELINPDVIVCCGTFQAYYKGIYDSDKNILRSAYNEVNRLSASIWSHNNRMVLYFYHPSNRMSKKDAFDLLCKVWMEGHNTKTN